MVAYTCDDIQQWVAWKYVNIAQNLQWIRPLYSDQSGAECRWKKVTEKTPAHTDTEFRNRIVRGGIEFTPGNVLPTIERFLRQNPNVQHTVNGVSIPKNVISANTGPAGVSANKCVLNEDGTASCQPKSVISNG